MLFALLVTVHVLVSLIIIGLVLLQAGKGADIGSAFGGGGSQAVFGSMGTPTVLGKFTTAVAVIFMLTSFSLAMLGHKRSTSIMPATGPAPRHGACARPLRARAGRRAGRRPTAPPSARGAGLAAEPEVSMPGAARVAAVLALAGTCALDSVLRPRRRGKGRGGPGGLRTPRPTATPSSRPRSATSAV